MADKVWLTDKEVGTRFGSTRQWVWVQARMNPNFPQPVKLTARWSRSPLSLFGFHFLIWISVVNFISVPFFDCLAKKYGSSHTPSIPQKKFTVHLRYILGCLFKRTAHYAKLHKLPQPIEIKWIYLDKIV